MFATSMVYRNQWPRLEQIISLTVLVVSFETWSRCYVVLQCGDCECSRSNLPIGVRPILAVFTGDSEECLRGRVAVTAPL